MSDDSYMDHDIKKDPIAKDENGSKPMDFRFILNKAEYSPLDPFVLGGLIPERGNIVMKEISRILKNWKNDSPSRKEILNDLQQRIYYSYASEGFFDDPFLKREVSGKYVEFNKSLLNAKSLKQSMSIVKKAEKEGVAFSPAYVNLLSLTMFLKDMEEKGLLELALEELYLVNVFNKSFVNMMIVRGKKTEENSRIKDFIIKTEEKLGSFIEYLDQVEDEWHPLQNDKKKKKISKNEAIAYVFNSHMKEQSFIQLFKDKLNIDITDDNGMVSAFKLFRRMFNKYTKYYYKIEKATKNGHEKKNRVVSDETKEKIGKAISRQNELKKIRKRRKHFHSVVVKNGEIILPGMRSSSRS